MPILNLHISQFVMKRVKNEGPLPKVLNSPADGTSVSLPLGCKSVVRPVVEDFSLSMVMDLDGSPGPINECHLLDYSTFFEVGPNSFSLKLLGI